MFEMICGFSLEPYCHLGKSRRFQICLGRLHSLPLFRGSLVWMHSVFSLISSLMYSIIFRQFPQFVAGVEKSLAELVQSAKQVCRSLD